VATLEQREDHPLFGFSQTNTILHTTTPPFYSKYYSNQPHQKELQNSNKMFMHPFGRTHGRQESNLHIHAIIQQILA
jgi:hypothetical protein